MIRILPSILFLLLVFGPLQAQITVTNSTFPQPGDTLHTGFDNLPTSIDVLSPGGNKQWNFTSLQTPFVRQSIIQNSSAGSASDEFPGASYMAEIDNLGEAYFKTAPDRLELLGYFGEDPQGLGVEVLTKFIPPSVEKWAPLQYQDSHNTETDFSLAFAKDELPDFIIDSLGGLPGVDSLRLRVNSKVDFLVDAWGTVMTPEGTFDVLRERRITIQENGIDAKFIVGGWLDLADILGADNELFQPDTILSYVFFNDMAKEPIAAVRMAENGQDAVSVEFKSSSIVSSVQPAGRVKPGLYAYPNPAISYMRFDFTGLKPGTYTLRMYNILGQEVWEREYAIHGDRTDRVSLTGFKKGTYLYSLQDSRGNTLLTKRFIIMRP